MRRRNRRSIDASRSGVAIARVPPNISRMMTVESLKRGLVSLVVVLGLGACSNVEVMHAVADDVLKSRVGDILDLSDPDDERRVSETVDRFFADATPSLAPVYANFLSAQAEVLEQKGDTLGRDDVAAMIADLRQLLRDSAEDLAPVVASVLVDHTTPERVAHMREALAEQRAERTEDRQKGSASYRRGERIERLTDNIERFIPDLNDAQQASIAAYVDADIAEDDDDRFYEYTERRHEALADFLLTGPDEQQIADYMVRWMTDGPALTDPAFVPQAEAWWQGRVDLFWSVVRDMDDVQRAETVRILRGYANDIAGLV